MKKIVLLVAGAVVLVSVLGLYYWNTLFASSSTSNIEGPSSGYLTYYPSFKGEKETMIFLVSTDNPWYGFYNWSDDEWWGGEVHEGDPCFIVNVTVRNDYKEPISTDEDSPFYGEYNVRAIRDVTITNNETDKLTDKTPSKPFFLQKSKKTGETCHYIFTHGCSHSFYSGSPRVFLLYFVGAL